VHNKHQISGLEILSIWYKIKLRSSAISHCLGDVSLRVEIQQLVSAYNSELRKRFVLIDLSQKVYPRKQKTVILHALPLAWSLVTSSSATSASGPLRDATTDFIIALYKLMGQSLYDHAASAPGSNNQELIRQIRDMTS